VWVLGDVLLLVLVEDYASADLNSGST